MNPEADANRGPKPSAVVPAHVPAKPAVPLSRRRLWLFRLAAMALGPAVFFLVVEIVLRLVGYGYDPHFFLKREIGGQSYLVQNEDFSRRFFPPETMRHPNALRMRAEKTPGTIRIFVIGESAAMGDPEPAFGPARYLEALLQQRFPERNFEVVNVAFTAINSHVLLPLARECAAHDGDLWIVYMGNNEMVGPYGAATILGTQTPPRWVVKLVTGVQRTRVGQLSMAIIRKLQRPGTSAGSWGGMAMFQKQRVAPNSPKREMVYQNFAANLEDLVQCGLDSGAGIILNTMAVNLHDSPPFASVNDETLTPEARQRFEELFQAGSKAQAAGEWTNAATCFGQALELDAGFAEAHYRRAMCLERAGMIEVARKHYQLACDVDALPFRTDAREHAVLRAAAERHAGDKLLLVDAPVILSRAGATGVCGQESFYEHVHFNFDGGYRLGLAWAQAVDQMLAGTAVSATNRWASQEFCERRLGLTDWNRKLVLHSVLQRLGVPPLNSQFNNPERAARLTTQERSLLANATEASVLQARGIFAEAIAARPDDHHVLEAYAVFLQASGDLPGALAEWRKIGELLPQDFLPWFQIGSIAAKQGDFATSELNLRKAIAVRPELVEGWSELGQCLGAQQKWLQALAAFERACELRPEEAMNWAFRAKVLGSVSRPTEAIDCYRKAVALNPSFAEAQAALGDQYSTAGKIPEAIAAYQAAIRARSGYGMAHLNLGVMFARQNRFDEAIHEFQATLSLEPSNQVAQDYLRQVQARRNQAR